MNNITLIKELKKQGIDLVNAETLSERALDFERALKIVIIPRDQSDRTTFRRITAWLVDGCKKGIFEEHAIFRRVIDFAIEASSPKSRNPAAVLMSILKKELGYKGGSKK